VNERMAKSKKPTAKTRAATQLAAITELSESMHNCKTDELCQPPQRLTRALAFIMGIFLVDQDTTTQFGRCQQRRRRADAKTQSRLRLGGCVGLFRENGRRHRAGRWGGRCFSSTTDSATRSEAALPLRSRNETIGVSISKHGKRMLFQQRWRFTSALANQSPSLKMPVATETAGTDPVQEVTRITHAE